jgi:hypothetical protein
MHAGNLILEHANIGQTIFRWKDAEISPHTADTKGKGGLVCFVDLKKSFDQLCDESDFYSDFSHITT